jgi:uncharacterized UPF0146 family protein
MSGNLRHRRNERVGIGTLHAVGNQLAQYEFAVYMSEINPAPTPSCGFENEMGSLIILFFSVFPR